LASGGGFQNPHKGFLESLEEDIGFSFMQQFTINISCVKKAISKWAKVYNEKATLQLREVESQIGSLLIEGRVDQMSEEEGVKLSKLCKKERIFWITRKLNGG
jgi:hypothetical protein